MYSKIRWEEGISKDKRQNNDLGEISEIDLQ